MRTASTLGVLLILVAGVRPADGALNLSWSACPDNPAAATSIDFDCDPLGGSQYSLYGTFSSPAALPGILALDVILDLRVPGLVAETPFWQLQMGACNEAGLLLEDARPATGCVGWSTTLCGNGGVGCDAFVVDYQFDGALGPGRARLFLGMTKLETSAVTLPALPAKHFAFRLLFLMDGAAADLGGCEGCESEVSITWNHARFWNIGPAPNWFDLTSTDAGSEPNAYVNCAGNCEAVASRRSRWGSLKAMYR